MADTKGIQKGISVIICCYNSASRLYETLRHLSLQKTDALLNWEIIVVDNASTDNTSIFAFETWSRLKNNTLLKIFKEMQPGLSFARQRGVQEAKYEYIIFCDDDNWLNENYLQTAFRLIAADDTIGAMGGISTAISDAGMPGWFANYGEAYAVGKQAPMPGIINGKGYVFGAGMVTRKAVFENTVNDNLPSILTDRKGQSLSGGGDVEYCLRLILQGYNICYTEELSFRHFIQAYRLTENYRDGLLRGAAEAKLILREYFEAIKIKNANNYMRFQLSFAAAKDFIKSILKIKRTNAAPGKVAFYLCNIGFRRRGDLAIIKHFFRQPKKQFRA